MQLRTSDRRRPASLNAVAAEVAATVLVHVSLWLLLVSMLSVLPPVWWLAAAALLPVPLYFLSRLKSFGTLLPVYAAVLPVAAGLLGYKFFGKGFLQLYDYLARAVNEVHELALFPGLSGYPASDVPELPALAALLLPAFLTAGLIAYAICRKVRPLAVLTCLLPVLPWLLTGLNPSVPVLIFYLVAVTFYLILLTTRSKGVARRLTWLNGEVSGALLVFLVVLALLLGGFERSALVDRVRDRIDTRITAFRYAPEDPADGMPGGDLTQADTVTYDGRPALTVTTPNAFSMYLKGFSGDVLEDGVWQPLSADTYFKDYSLTGPWVRSDHFSPAISLGQLLDLKWQVQTAQHERGERKSVTMARYPVTIRNERAFRDTVFLPYEVSESSKGLGRADLSHEGAAAKGLRGRRSYELTVYQPLTTDYGNVSAGAIIGEDAPYNELYEGAFVPAEKVYRDFVSAYERDIPEAYRAPVAELARAAGLTGSPSKDVFRIRSLFGTRFQFSLDVAPPAGEDPLLSFMNGTRTGYDTHFASLAVLLFRQAGIPARYAEGYYISKDLAASVDSETEVELSVPDSASHAWVELYKDGVGWVPVEVTPGYYETEPGSSPGTSSQGQTEQPEEVAPPETPEEEENPVPDEQSERDASSDTEKQGSLLPLLLPLLLLVLLVPLIGNTLARRKIRRAEDRETTALAYRYLERVLRLYGLRPERRRPAETAALLGDDRKAYLSAIGLFYKETFSEEGLTPEERHRLCDTVLDLTANTKQLSRARRALRNKTVNQREEHHGE